MRLTITRLVAAIVLAAATGLVLPTPAQAAACSTASGVTVVVDFHELGGGVQQVCDAGGAGDDAATQFEDSGFALTRVQRQPGFVCRVNDAPSSDQESCVNTPPSDAYWGLWWSDGKSGEWTYASQGVDSLTVPEGGYVALSWNGSSTKSPPGATPTAHPTASPAPSPTHQPTHAPSQHPTTGGGTPTAAATSSSESATAAPSAAASSSGPAHGGTHGHQQGRRHQHRASPSAGSSSSAPATAAPSAPATATASDVPAADAPTPDDGGLPAWVAPAVIAVLFAAAGAIALVRRRRAG